jgi:hypothetical protein
MVEKQTVLQQRNFDEHECAIDQQATDDKDKHNHHHFAPRLNSHAHFSPLNLNRELVWLKHDKLPNVLNIRRAVAVSMITRSISPEITRPIHADGRPMPTAEQPAATGKHVIPTHIIPARVIPRGMDMPAVSLPMMLLYAIVTGDSGRHKHQSANYSRDEANSV